MVTFDGSSKTESSITNNSVHSKVLKKVLFQAMFQPSDIVKAIGKVKEGLPSAIMSAKLLKYINI